MLRFLFAITFFSFFEKFKTFFAVAFFVYRAFAIIAVAFFTFAVLTRQLTGPDSQVLHRSPIVVPEPQNESSVKAILVVSLRLCTGDK